MGFLSTGRGEFPAAGSTSAYNNWPDFVQEARNDLEKQPATFADPENATNPLDPSQVAPNLLEHLDEVIRIALWDYAIPIKIKVGQKRKRHHGLTTEWKLEPIPGPIPGVEPTLTINIDCPQGGWQGYTFWRKPSSTGHITNFVATWTVPPAPQVNDDQIIFIFNGLKSVSAGNAVGGILQPVLQWTKENQWLIRSWYIRADFDPVQYPALPDPTKTASNYNKDGTQDNRSYSIGVAVNPNDIIVGTIQGGINSNGKFNYNCSLKRNGQDAGAALQLTDVPELIYAVCAVESYYVPEQPLSHVGFYPATQIGISSISLQVEQSSITPIGWIPSKTLGRDYNASKNAAGDTVTFTLA